MTQKTIDNFARDVEYAVLTLPNNEALGEMIRKTYNSMLNEQKLEESNNKGQETKGLLQEGKKG